MHVHNIIIMTHMCAHYKTLAVTLMIKVYLGGGGGGGGGEYRSA